MTLRFPLFCCAAGLQATWITLVLLALEISLSFNNAVVNARVLERRLSSAGRVPSLEVALSLVILMLVSWVLPSSLRSDVLFAGLIGLVLQILSTSLAEFFGGEEEAVGRMAASGGLASLVYLELLDASFSLDGTIGAFAITSDLGLILTGRGLGALFIRSLTVMLSREKALDQLIDLEPSAHDAIGALGLLMLADVVIGRWGWQVPEWLSGLISAPPLPARSCGAAPPAPASPGRPRAAAPAPPPAIRRDAPASRWPR